VGNSSVCFTAGYQVPDWTRYDAEARPGELVEWMLRSQAQRRDNRVTIYLPARYQPAARYPLLVVHDGGDYLEYSAMKTVLDNLIHRLDMAETVVAFTYPGERLTEYPNSAAHARWMVGELLPELEDRLSLIGQPHGRCLMGAQPLHAAGIRRGRDGGQLRRVPGRPQLGVVAGPTPRRPELDLPGRAVVRLRVTTCHMWPCA
jgi:enterochelin esterase-like enzyme